MTLPPPPSSNEHGELKMVAHSSKMYIAPNSGNFFENDVFFPTDLAVDPFTGNFIIVLRGKLKILFRCR